MATKTRSTKASRAPSLAANAAAAHAAKVTRLAAEGRAAIRAVRARAAQNSANYYDIGESLRTLARDGVAEALGRADFAEVCALDLDMSLTHARRLMDITERLRRDIGETMSIRRAGALVALADATPDDDDAEGLLGATLLLPDGERLAVASASTESLQAAAAAIRAARGAPARGLTKTREERAAFQAPAVLRHREPGARDREGRARRPSRRRGGDPEAPPREAPRGRARARKEGGAGRLSGVQHRARTFVRPPSRYVGPAAA